MSGIKLNASGIKLNAEVPVILVGWRQSGCHRDSSGSVSLGQYYSTVRAIHSPHVYIKIIIRSGCPSAEGRSLSPL
jgi:hypothetical protein